MYITIRLAHDNCSVGVQSYNAPFDRRYLSASASAL